MRFSSIKTWLVSLCVLALVACGGGGGDAGTPIGSDASTPTMTLSLSTTTVTSSSPATVTATVSSATGTPVTGVVVTFATTSSLGVFSATTALTNSKGVATVTLTPASSATAGADTVTATATASDTSLTASAGFSLVATTAGIASFASTNSGSVSAYGQVGLTLTLSGVSSTAPATVTFSSLCATLGKATLSSTSVAATSSTVELTYKDTGGCGSVRTTDIITASISGSSATSQLTLNLASPAANNIVFVSASPTQIYLKGSGFTTSSTVTFQVNDSANNPLPGKSVALSLSSYAGGLSFQGSQTSLTQTTDSSGQVSVLVNSGTVPTPVRVLATESSTGASTVSSSLVVAVGLPSQLNFSLSQTTKNIEGYDIDGTSNTYTIYAADRSGNPVPADTAITFWAEGGQVGASGFTTLSTGGIASASAAFVSQSPRPADGRVTIVAYAIGEESFIDSNGNNSFDSGEPFQDLGDVTKDMLFDYNFNSSIDEWVSLAAVGASGSSTCVNSSATYANLALIPVADAWIPSRPGTCDGTWTQRTYVRRSTETVLSRSTAEPLWNVISGLASSCTKITKQYGPSSDNVNLTKVALSSGDVWYANGVLEGSLSLLVADSNTVRYNPMAAGTTVTASTTTTGLTVSVIGTPIVNTTAAYTPMSLVYSFDASTGTVTNPGTITLTFTSPSGVGTSYTITLNFQGTQPSTCSLP